MHLCYQEYLWGRSRLRQNCGKAYAPNIATEGRELHCYSDGLKRTVNGGFQNATLLNLVQKQVNLWFDRYCMGDLVKLIHVKQNLST